MFNPLTLAVAALVAVIVLAAVVVIRQLGPGRVRRSLRCPETGSRARLQVLYTEPVWGTLQASDVTRCSLFGPGPVTCEKQCLARL